MSTRAMGRLYGGMAGRGGGGRVDPNQDSLLSILTGQNRITPGSITTTPEGMPQVNPFVGSPGIFGGRSRANAAALTAPLLQQQLEGMYGLLNTKEQGAQTRETAKGQSKIDLAKTHDVSIDDIDKLAPLLGENATTALKYKLAAMDPTQEEDWMDKNLLQAHRMGNNLSATGVPPNTAFPNVPAGGIAIAPPIPGVGNPPVTVRGATQAPQGVIINPVTGMPMPIGGGQRPGGVSEPLTQDDIDKARAANEQTAPQGNGQPPANSLSDVMRNPQLPNMGGLSTTPPSSGFGMQFNPNVGKEDENTQAMTAPATPTNTPSAGISTTPTNSPYGMDNYGRMSNQDYLGLLQQFLSSMGGMQRPSDMSP